MGDRGINTRQTIDERKARVALRDPRKIHFDVDARRRGGRKRGLGRGGDVADDRPVGHRQ